MQNKYPLWKNLLLIAIIAIGLVYVIPNLYTEYPIVQVSSQSPTPIVPQELEAKVRASLEGAKLNFQAITVTDDRLEVRFMSTDTQLLARDVIKNALGAQYTVALNLAPSTPAWLSAIHEAGFGFAWWGAFSSGSGYRQRYQSTL